MSEKTMFPREDHTEMLFQKILNDPWACDRLMETFNENLVYNDEFDVSLPAEKFAKALFNASYQPRSFRTAYVSVQQHRI